MDGISLRTTKFGRVIVSSDDKGICGLEFVDDLTELFDPGAEVPHELLGATIAFVNGESSGVIPISLSGTSFQEEVWRTLMRVPRGATISYMDLSKHIGRPKAVRAVANACGANKIAVLIPCHRVIRSNGELGGYAWGTDLKKDLLNFEKHN